ncbi:hypothetical protein U9M48_017100 [Paspalum notatum var. saurae]|uniref:Uncharacterized protein n=1 Tax=Paspalum notatum var. saurae TaxID=547442 RepID=A0AAQ3T8S6_PASNO
MLHRGAAVLQARADPDDEKARVAVAERRHPACSPTAQQPARASRSTDRSWAKAAARRSPARLRVAMLKYLAQRTGRSPGGEDLRLWRHRAGFESVSHRSIGLNNFRRTQPLTRGAINGLRRIPSSTEDDSGDLSRDAVF